MDTEHESGKKIQAFDMKCLRKVLMISWKQKKTNEYVKKRNQKKVREVRKPTEHHKDKKADMV